METNLAKILKTLSPVLNPGSYVFCSLPIDHNIPPAEIVCTFREEEGTTLIIKKETADVHALKYSVVMSWITLTVHSSLEAVGLTAAFSKALADADVSCNVVAGLHHDHIFVPARYGQKALEVLNGLS